MNNTEILDKARKEKRQDEMYMSMSCKSNKIAAAVMTMFVVVLVIVLAITKNQSACFALLSAFFAYASTFYMARFVLLKSKYVNLIGGIICGIICVTMTVLFILAVV